MISDWELERQCAGLGYAPQLGPIDELRSRGRLLQVDDLPEPSISDLESWKRTFATFEHYEMLRTLAESTEHLAGVYRGWEGEFAVLIDTVQEFAGFEHDVYRGQSTRSGYFALSADLLNELTLPWSP